MMSGRKVPGTPNGPPGTPKKPPVVSRGLWSNIAGTIYPTRSGNIDSKPRALSHWEPVANRMAFN